jgi:peptidoglycan/LPS O-acetylase OafA/YrhL
MHYQPRLDSLRFFSVVMVIISHWLPNSEIVKSIPFIGNVGVSFFFVLSGYLITSNLIKLKNQSLFNSFKIFYINRALRIFPIYYFFLLGLILLIPSIYNVSFKYYLAYLTNFRIFRINYWPEGFSHLWSLAIEEQFYLFWPLVVLLPPLKKLKSSIFITFLMAIILKFLTYTFSSSSFIDLLPYSQFDLFMFGALLSIYKPSLDLKLQVLKKHQTFLVFIFLCLLVYFFGSSYLIKNIALGLLSIFLISSTSLSNWFLKVTDIKLFVFCGKISYGLYLYHNFIPLLERNMVGIETKNKFINPFLPNIESAFYHLFLQSILLLIICVLSWFLIEKRFLKLKNFNY